MRRWLLVVGCVMAISGRAHADPRGFTIGSQPAWFLLGGVTAGGTVAFHDRGGFVGGELSLARLREARFVGVYADAYYDFGVDGTYVTAGPELGWKIVALDGGVALRRSGGDTQLGGAVRASIGVGMFSVYCRYLRFDSTADRDVIQVGAFLKLPLF